MEKCLKKNISKILVESELTIQDTDKEIAKHMKISDKYATAISIRSNLSKNGR